MLADQVDSQIEKIGDLEKLLDDKKEVLRRTEDILQREMINRSALETKKLELLTDLSQVPFIDYIEKLTKRLVRLIPNSHSNFFFNFKNF